MTPQTQGLEQFPWLQYNGYIFPNEAVHMKKQIDAYNFEKISSRMTKTFGVIERYLEDKYAKILFLIESNLLKTHRKNGINSGKSVIEAIHICLFTIDGYLNQTEYDFDPYISDANKPFLTALLMSFDPFANKYLKKIVEEQCDIHSKEGLRDYFVAPVKCLLRIEKTVMLWTKKQGDGGYFTFLENQIGESVADDDIMNCVIVKLTNVDTPEGVDLMMEDFFSDMSLNEIIMELFPAISAIFKLGYIPLPDEFYELTQEQYAAYRRQGGDLPEPLYTVVPKNYKYLGPSNEISILSNEEIFKLGKGAVFLHLYATKNGCDSRQSEDVLKFAAERLPSFFTNETKFKRPPMKALEPDEVPLTEREEIIDLLAHVMGEGKKLDIKMTFKDANENIEKVETLSLPIEKQRQSPKE
jgi:hypothetical protein